MADTAAPADWVLELMRDFQDTLTCGLYEAIYTLDDATVEPLMRSQAHACVAGFLKFADLRVPMSVDEFLVAIRTAAPSQIDITRDGDVIDWRERHSGACVCPFVKREVIRLDPKLCMCGAHWVQRLFEVVARTPVDIEIGDTVASGAEDCHFRIRLRGPVPAA